MLRMCTASVFMAFASAAAAGDLNLLTWEGYADASFAKPFEQQTRMPRNRDVRGHQR